MENIAHLMSELPKDYEEECIKQGAIVRRRGVSNPADLMMLAMFHLQNGCSLVEMSEVARITKLGNMSDVAFMKRFEKCGNWFKSINQKLASSCLIDYQKSEWLERKTVIAVDASDVAEKGRSGRIYRLHFALDIFKMISIEYKITTAKVGESICNFTLQPGYLVIADRAYANIKGIEHCNKNNAEYIFRLRKNSFTVRNEEGKKIDLGAIFAKLTSGECADLSVLATNLDGDKIPVRICAKRKTPEAIEQTKKKLRRKESKNQCVISEEAKTFNEYIVVATNLNDTISADEILETYRLRWQVEIYFKRLKSILNYGELPKRRHDSVIAWLNGKLMIALLIEIIISKAAFPPQEYA
ncbi:IS4 family transposase [Acidilutibacter cellobiosedens]|jgi:IS4 transposase|uniref:IS4 family transposase n=2 Tax=Acidilutibacter cellobiosedens TaxID=2507161 RepID=A0A410QGV1_9FIRM|nr:IS4 family transposase [Acidilutibacter cellobiosedens]